MSAPEQLSETSHVRTVAGSLFAGVAAMTLLGAMASFVMHGGLDTPAAAAATPEERFFATPVRVEPLDVAAVQAEINRSQAQMKAVQEATARAMARLERLD